MAARWRRWAFRLTAIASLSDARSGHAMMLGATGFAGFNTHAMQMWNDDLAAANAAGASFDAVDLSFSYGAGGRAWLSPSWLVQLAWEPLSLASHDDATARRLTFDATTVQLDVGWFLPTPRRSRYGLGFGLGRTSLHGSRELNGRKNADLSGDTWGAQILGLADWPVGSSLAITGTLGYRMAMITETRVDGHRPTPPIETDYSGFVSRVGLAFYRRFRIGSQAPARR